MMIMVKKGFHKNDNLDDDDDDDDDDDEEERGDDVKQAKG